MQSFILHHISQPLCCTHKRSIVIRVNLLWEASPCDESLQGTDKLFCPHGFRQFEVQGKGQAASVQDYVGFPLPVSANTLLHWIRIVNTDDLKGRSSHSIILMQVSWRGVLSMQQHETSCIRDIPKYHHDSSASFSLSSWNCSGTLPLCFLLPEKLLVVFLLRGESACLPLLPGVPCVVDEPLDPRSYSQTAPKASP